PRHGPPEARLPPDLEEDEKQADRDEHGGGEVERPDCLEVEQEEREPRRDRQSGPDAAEDPVHRGTPVPELLQRTDERVGGIGKALLVLRIGRNVAARHGRRGVEVLDLRVGADRGVQLHGRLLARQARHVALRIVEVPEEDRLRDARGREGGRRVWVDAGNQAAGEPIFDPPLAESAFLRDADALGVRRRPLLQRLSAVVALLLVHDRPRVVRARDCAVGAADADVVVHRDEAVLALARRTGGAHRHAGRLGAVLAAGHEKEALDVREGALLDVEHAPPLHLGPGVVRVLAGDRAGLAADAPVEVDDHAPARRLHALVDGRIHACIHRRHAPSLRTLTPITSETLPVPSVSLSDRSVSALRLGRSRSFAYGVFQWLNWPIMRSVSGRMPSRSTARPSVLPTTDSMTTRSPSAMPSFFAALRLMMTPRWPEMLFATSLIIGRPTFAPQLYCMERAVSAQKGNSSGSRSYSRAYSTQMSGNRSYFGMNSYSSSWRSHQRMPASCSRLASWRPWRVRRSWYGSSKRRFCRFMAG